MRPNLSRNRDRGLQLAKMATRKDRDRRKPGPVPKILALGLIWAVGVLALVVERLPNKHQAPAARPGAAVDRAAPRRPS